MHKPTPPIKNGRPLLRLFNPPAYWNTLIFGWFNILLGTSLALALDRTRVSTSLIIVNELFSFLFWGIVFVVLGVFQLYAVRTNRYQVVRWGHRLGTVLKSAWGIALIVRAFISPGTILISLLWFTLMLLQIVTFIFIPIPKLSVEEEDTNGSRQ